MSKVQIEIISPSQNLVLEGTLIQEDNRRIIRYKNEFTDCRITLFEDYLEFDAVGEMAYNFILKPLVKSDFIIRNSIADINAQAELLDFCKSVDEGVLIISLNYNIIFNDIIQNQKIVFKINTEEINEASMAGTFCF